MSITIGSSETQNIQIEVSDSQSVQVTDSPTQLISIEAAGRGPTGLPGAGLAAGGEVGQLIAKASTTDYDTEWTSDINVTSIDISSGNAVLSWNDQDGTIDVAYANGVTLQVGQEQHFYAKATEPIADGDIVMFAGAQGSHSLISKADMSSPSFFPQAVMGIATQSFVTNQFGYVTSFGKVRGIDLSDYENKDLLYLDPDNAGKFVTVSPTPPDHAILVAAVVDNKNNGTMLVRVAHKPDTDEIAEGVTNLYYTDARADARIAAAKLRDIGNVLSSPATPSNSIIAYNQALDLWLPTLNPQLSSINANTATFTTVSVAQQLLFSGGGGNIIGAGIGTDDLLIESNGNVTVLLDKDGNETNQKFIVADSASSAVNETKFSVDENGDTYVAGSLGVGIDTPEETLHVTPSVLVGTKGFASPLSGQLRAASPNTSYGELGFTSQYDNFAAGFRSYGLSSNYNRDLRFYTKDTVSSADGAERMRITEAGNVGIGTTSPSAPLTVIGNSYLQGDVAVGPQATAGPISGYTLSVRDVTPSIYLKDQTGVVGDGRLHVNGNIFSIGVDPNNATTNAALRFETRGSERMRIDHDGNVGIGTTTPAAKLDISDSNSNIAVFRTTNANADLYLRASGTGSDGKVGIRASDNNLRFISNGATQASFNGSNLGIGTTTPSEKLHVVGNVDSQAIYVDRTNEGAGINSPFAKLGLHYLHGSANNLILQKTGKTTYTSFNTNDSGFTIADSANPNQYFMMSNTGITGYSGFSFKYVQHNSSTNNLGEVLVLDNSVASNGQRGTAKITGDVTLHDYSSGTGVERVRIGNDGSAWFDGGNVGIGTTTPSEALHVVGNVVVDSGNSNMFIGDSTTGDSITGENNIAIGSSAMRSATATSQYGVSIGSGAGRFGSQSHGMCIGFTAGYNGAQSSTYVGSSAGKNAAGQRNVGIGYLSGGGSSNGVQSLYGNVSIGYQAGQVLETAATAVGYQALTALTTGTNNTAVGYQAGDGILAGTQNTLIGYNADIANANGAYNVIVGDSVSTNSGGNYATRVGSIGAVGNQAVSVGYGAGSTSGNGSISIGYNAGKGNGTFNVYVGTSAGEVTGGSDSVGIGYLSNRWTTGGSNVSIGREAAEGDATSTFSNTVAIGYQAGTSLTTGGSNVLIGYQAGSTLTTESNKLYIENSNSTTPLIYGEFDNDILRVNGTLEVTEGVTIDETGLASAGDYGKGSEVWYQGTGATTAGSLYYLNSSGDWANTDASAASTAKGMLAFAAGTDSDVDGMVTKGFVYLGTDAGGSVGDVVYLSETASLATTTAPTTSGAIVRVIGYKVATNVIWFNPSNDYFEVE